MPKPDRLQKAMAAMEACLPAASSPVAAARLTRSVVASFEQVAPTNAAELYDADEVDSTTYVFEVARSSDGSTYALSLSTHEIQVLSSDTFQRTATLRGHTGTITDLKFSQRSPAVLYSSGEDGRVSIWDTRGGGGEAIQCDAEANCTSIGCGETLLAVASGTAVHFYDLRNRKKLGMYADNHTGATPHHHHRRRRRRF